MKGLRVGIAGLGGAGRAHARRFAAHPGVASVLGWDPGPAAGAGVERARTFEELLERCDALSVCSPDDAHAAQAGAALEAGRHVLVEKPLAASAAEGEALLRRARPGLVLAVHLQMRFVPAFRRAAERLRAGELGRLFYAEANYWHDMRRRAGRYDDWRLKRGQSVLLGAGIHPIDLVLSLVPSEPVRHATFLSKGAFGAYPTPYTSSTTLLGFRDGTAAKCHANFCADYPQLNDLILLGEEGSWVNGALVRGGRLRSLEPPVGSGRAGLWRRALARAASRSPAFRAPPFSLYDHEAACAAVVDGFVRAARGEGGETVGAEEALKALRLCEAAERDGLSGSGAP